MELVKKNGKVIEMANRASIQKLSSESLSGLTSRIDSHESGLNTNAHQISNVAGLQAELDGKADVGHTHSVSNVIGLQDALDGKADSFTGFTGSVTVVTGVDFGAGTTTTAIINIDNGIITSIS